MTAILSDTPTGAAGSYGIATTLGMAVRKDAEVTIYGMAWYRHNTDPDDKPTQIGLHYTPSVGGTWFRPVDEQVPPDNGEVGWQVLTFATPVVIPTGHDIIPHGGFGSGVPWWYIGNGSRPALPAGWSWPAGDASRANYSGATHDPSSANDNLVALFNLYTDPIEPAGPDPGDPTTFGNLNTALADWLDVEEGTQENSAPLLSNAKVNAIFDQAQAHQTALLNILGNSASGGGATSTTAMGRLAHLILAGAATAEIAANIAGLVELIRGDQEEEGPTIAQTLAVVEALTVTFGLDLARRNEAINPGVWTLEAEETFEGPFIFNEVADRYRINVADYGSARVLNLVAAFPVLYRFGWWSAITNDVASERKFIDFPKQDLWIPGTRMHGLLVDCWPEATGTIQAWKRD